MTWLSAVVRAQNRSSLSLIHIYQETDTLEKNGIAVCEILLTEGIVADLFSNHKVLGELILIDRVTNMTSACGVVDAVSEKVSSTADRNSFQYGDLKARGDVYKRQA